MSRLFAPVRVHSLRRRLLAGVCAAVLLLWIAAAWFNYSVAQDEAEELIDGNLTQVARLLLAAARNNESRLGDLSAQVTALRGTIDNAYDPPLEFQVGRGDGTVLARTENAPPVPILGAAGFSDILRKDGSWRVLNAVSADEKYRVQVAYSIAMRDKAAFELSLAAVLPLVLISPLLVLLIYISIRAGLRPLERLAAQVAQRNVENLAPLEKDKAPEEALPLVDALNRLLRRLDATLENERRFTSDAAHELRTPLAAVRIQAQVALASTDGVEHRHALQQVLAGAERAGRLVEQLLRIARLDPLASLPDPRSVDLVQLARASARSFTDASCSQRANLRFELDGAPVRIEGDADLLDMAMRNLIDNALRYTLEGTPVTVVARMENGEAVLGVRDAGGGVAAEELPSISQRFYRGRQTMAEGSGLGLAIVRRIAQLHAARLEIANAPGGGFVVLLRWTVAPAGRSGSG
jgi:two-component system sensor histidine kinase QseC